MVGEFIEMMGVTGLAHCLACSASLINISHHIITTWCLPLDGEPAGVQGVTHYSPSIAQCIVGMQ